MTERQPVRTLADLRLLSAEPLSIDEIAEGYLDGLRGEPEPGDNRSRAYWHGWRNGAVDGGHRPKDDAQAALAYDYVRSVP